MNEIQKLKEDRKLLEDGIGVLAAEFCAKNPEMTIEEIDFKLNYISHVKSNDHVLTEVDVNAKITLL